jgi:release factor glutamine methyltransferase
MTDLELLVRDKYDGDADKVNEEDTARLAAGEPLAYVIGWVPFLDLRIGLDSHPLIPRPETEWWTEQLIAHLRTKFGTTPFQFLDLCAGSGAIGLAVLHALPNAYVAFGELVPEHCAQIRLNIAQNNLDANRALVRESNLFNELTSAGGTSLRFDIIATNPPYIPEGRILPESVAHFEPAEALFAGKDALDLIRTIAANAPDHLSSNASAELWMETDTENIREAAALLGLGGAQETVILTDPYDRPRVVVAYYT